VTWGSRRRANGDGAGSKRVARAFEHAPGAVHALEQCQEARIRLQSTTPRLSAVRRCQGCGSNEPVGARHHHTQAVTTPHTTPRKRLYHGTHRREGREGGGGGEQNPWQHTTTHARRFVGVTHNASQNPGYRRYDPNSGGVEAVVVMASTLGCEAATGKTSSRRASRSNNTLPEAASRVVAATGMAAVLSSTDTPGLGSEAARSGSSITSSALLSWVTTDSWSGSIDTTPKSVHRSKNDSTSMHRATAEGRVSCEDHEACSGHDVIRPSTTQHGPTMKKQNTTTTNRHATAANVFGERASVRDDASQTVGQVPPTHHTYRKRLGCVRFRRGTVGRGSSIHVGSKQHKHVLQRYGVHLQY